jgi:hypothetical protein
VSSTALAAFATVSAVQRLNTYRIDAGLSPVRVDPQLSAGCQAHADYLVANRINLETVQLAAHTEHAGLPGYSAAGAAAASNSIIFQGVSASAAVDQWLQTLYHRLGLFDPNLKAVGCGAAGDFLVLDDDRGRVTGFAAAPGCTLFPPDGWTDVPGSYRREIPHPVPGDDSLGIPITIEFFGSLGRDITDVAAHLVDGRTGAEIPFYLQWPGHPLLAGWNYQQLIVLVPRDPLPGQCPVTVAVSARVDGKPWLASWTFTTR